MTENQDPKEKTVPFFPDHLFYEAKVALLFGIVLILIGVVGLFYPVGLGEPADPMITPEHTTPEWYFLWLFQFLKYIPSTVLGIEGKVLGAVFPVLLVGILAIWPFLDNKPDNARTPVRTRAILAAVVMIIIIILTILGEVG
jgi:quinol-cytochrome oxidoreductase complex cytochrome b subunit